MLEIDANKELTYSLPTITDPDGDKCKIEVDLKDSLAFSKFASNTFIFKPKDTNARSNPYSIKIILTDDNASKILSKAYDLKVQVMPNKKNN